MKTAIKYKVKDYKTLGLKGVEIVSVTETSGDDLKRIQLRDTVTGTEFALAMSTYSDFYLEGEKPKEFKDRFQVTGKLGTGKATSSFDTKEQADVWIEECNITEAVITQVKEEVL